MLGRAAMVLESFLMSQVLFLEGNGLGRESIPALEGHRAAETLRKFSMLLSASKETLAAVFYKLVMGVKDQRMDEHSYGSDIGGEEGDAID